jgi:signal transduction histidine kinase
LKDNTYGDLSDRGVKRCEGASRNVQRLIDLIGNLLDIERMEAGRMNLNHSHFPVEAVLTQAVDSVRDMADKNNLNLSVRSTDIEIYGDLNLLTRVVTNFLSNAVKYSPEGSTITIKAEPVDNSVHVSVADEGVGIPLKSLPFVFERFKQVQSEEKQKAGSGLGLAICKSIVEAHDGEVGVTSEEGKGSTFWFSLPLAKPAAVTA